ncbi:MAG: Respiratory supercomplex factor 1, mitochondrial [Sarea resinae]|nr:MAG: Respiratory supercomplex factor 1, mitochondrial [Sarea resinae]
MSNLTGDPLPSSFDSDPEFFEESPFQKLTRRLKEEPLVPLGCALTCFALYRASISMRRGDHQTTNRMFRARIYAQGFTLLAIVAGSAYYKSDREKRKQFEGVVAEKRNKEKNEAWIRELEARDREEKEFQARREARQAALGNGGGVGGARSAVEKEEAENKGGVLRAVRDLVQGRS